MSDLVRSEYGFMAPKRMLEALKTLSECAGGWFGSIIGYTPSAAPWTSVPTYDVTFISRFDTQKLYQRKIKALESMDLSLCVAKAREDERFSVLDDTALGKLFCERIATEMNRLRGTDPSTQNLRDAHARCYAQVVEGVRVHFVTEKNADGIMVPIMLDGLPVADCIKLNAIEQSRTYRVPGVRKTVKSGLPVLASKIIASLLNRRSVGFVSFSLRDNFETVRVGGQIIASEDELYSPEFYSDSVQDD